MQDHTPQLPLFTIVSDDLPPIVPITNPKVKDLTGQRFGRLTVLGFVGLNKYSHATWLCRCDCGRHRVIVRTSLMSGHSRSCGCLQREWAIAQHLTHGMAHTREFGAWQTMINRCENPNVAGYKTYGAKGITVCSEWRHSFEQFLADMGPRPGTEYSLDRIDNDLGYSSENCRWATRTEQANNTSRNRFLEFRGERLTVAQWARRIGARPMNLYDRLHKGWSVERALTEPIKRR